MSSVPPVQRALAAAVVLIAAIAGFAALRHDRPASAAAADAQRMSAAQLSDLSAEIGMPIFWAGAPRRATIHVSRSGRGAVVVSYRAPGTRLDGVSIATYRMAHAEQNLRRQAQRDASLELATARDGRSLLIDRDDASSVYLAGRGEAEQVEVTGRGGTAVKLAAAAAITPCCGS